MSKSTHAVLALAAVLLLALAGSGCTAKMKASYHLKRADNYFAAGQYDLAEIEYKNALKGAPRNAEAWSRLGIIYFEQGRLAISAQVLRQAEQLSTTNLDARVKLGAIDLVGGNLKDAQGEANFVLDKNLRDEQAPVLLARAAGTNEIAATRKRLQVLAQKNETAAVVVALGILSFRESDFKTAETQFKRALTIDPKSSDAYSALANLYVTQKDLKQADQAFKSAADLSLPRSGAPLQYAQFKILTGDTASGKTLLNGIVKAAPDYLPGWLALAELAITEKNYADAATFVGDVLSRDPQNIEGLLLQGRLALLQGRTMEAISEMQQMAKMYPQTPAVHYQLALAYLNTNEINQAIGSLNQAIILNPNFADAILLLSEIQLRNGEIMPAVVSLRQLIRQQPQLASAQLLLAKAYQVQGDVDASIRIYRQLEAAYPDNVQVPFMLGMTLLQQNNNAAARQEFDRALKLAPDNLQILEEEVNLDLLEKQYAAAQQRVQQQAEKNPALQLLLAKVFIAQGQTNQAENTLSKTIQSQPDFAPAYLMLAQLYIAANQGQKAIADLQASLAKNPANGAALMLMGMTYEMEKDYKNARDAYEKLLVISPNNGIALNNLAYLYAEHLNDLDRAYDLARRARDLAPADASVADTLGWILYLKGNYSSALGLLQDSAIKLYSEPEAQFHLGMAYYMMADEKNARAGLQRALQMDPNLPEKKQCDECLSVLAVDPQTATAAVRTQLEKQVASRPNDMIALEKLAVIYQRDGDVDKAIAAYQTALNANSQNVPAMINLAQLYSPRDAQKALSLAKSAYQLAPNDSTVTHVLGRLAFQTGDYQWASDLLQLAAQTQPQNPDVLYDLGESLYSIGHVPEAQTQMQNALQTGNAFARADDARRFLTIIALAENPSQALAAQSQVDAILKSAPDYVPALMVKAAIANQKGDLAGAVQIYGSVLNHYPDFAPAQKQLATLYAKDPQNDDKAYALAVKAQKVFPDDAEVEKTLGIIVFRQADYARAVSLLRESERQKNSDAETMYYLGMAQYHLKNRADSKISLQRALDLNLAGAPAAQAKQILAELK